MGGNHQIDTQQVLAYEKSVAADRLTREGRLGEGRALMAEAASLDLTYAVRAEYLGQFDDRRVQVSKTVRTTLVPFLLAAGFGVKGGGSWLQGSFLERSHEGGGHDALLIGVDKFGHRLGVLAARDRSSGVEYFDWRSIGLRSGTLAYVTQRELEAVCAQWQQLMRAHVFPWWEAHEAAQ